MDGRNHGRARVAVLGAVAVLAAGIALASSPGPAGAQADDECVDPVTGFWRCEDLPPRNPGPPGEPPPPEPPDGDGEGGPVHPCPWRRHPNQDELQRLYPDAPDDAILLYRFCDIGPVPGARLVDGQFFRETTWVLPGEPGSDSPVGGLSPEQVAQMLLAGMPIEDPEAVVWPAPDVAAIVGIPTFVEVTNWVGELSDDDCFAGFCVEVVATPSLSFHPGEHDPATGWAAGDMACEAPGSIFDPASGRAGTAYDPDGAEPGDQAAAAGSCAYAYRLRSGVGERPPEWPGQVIVTWEATWSSTVSGSLLTGDFDPILMTTDLPRSVDEVQTPVSDADLGGQG